MPLAAALVVAALAGSWWWTTSGTGLPDGVQDALDALPGVERPVEPGQEPTAPDLPPPSPEVVALADAAHLSDEGRALFYGTQPEILDAVSFAGRCTDDHLGDVGAAAPERLRGEAVGCYIGGVESIVVYAPADARLYGYVVETAAHETLHAAWNRLDSGEQDQLAPLLEAELALLPADDAMHEQIAGSVGDRPENRPTELFAYIGTQIWRDGGLAPELEAAYARVVADRAALVAVHTGWQGMLDGMAAEIQAASTALSTQQSANAQSRAQLDADTASVAFYRQSTADKEAEVAAMTEDQRQRLRLSWVWWDGTDLPMAPAAETLATATTLLTRDSANLAARESTLATAEAAALAEHTRIDAVLSDLQALQAQLSPVTAAG